MASGKQDYWNSMLPSKSIEGPGQAMFWWTEHLDVPAASYNSATIYTVPSGKKLVLVGIDISCSASEIQRVTLLAGSSAIYDSYYDKEKQSVFLEGSITLGPGAELKRYIYNNDGSSTRTFDLNIFGYTINA